MRQAAMQSWSIPPSLAVFAVFLLGPFLAGLLLITLIIVSVANLNKGTFPQSREVEHRRFELLTFSLRTRRSTN